MKSASLLSILCALILLSGCATEPWVKPYERANLADPIMSFNRNPVSASYLHHVYDSREGARGAGIATGGGCGCN
ncbi:MAG: DUF4266 domain-containing protein [Gammaproteobacteria bacterium]|jgi:hypothetical protein|nr:DUF4266 domain-containing protein [Gammaproteobacteria bacterium]